MDVLVRFGGGQPASRTGSEKLQKVISLNLHLSVIHLKYTSCLFWSDLMEFSNANWMCCSELTTVDTGVAGKRGLRTFQYLLMSRQDCIETL